MSETNNSVSKEWESIVSSKESATLYLDASTAERVIERTETLAYWAAFYGQLELLKWLKDERGVNLLPARRYSHQGIGQRVPVDGSSGGGHAEVLEYFLEIGYKLESNQFRSAIKGGHLEFLKHFHFKGYDLTRDVFLSSDAARYGHLQIVQFLHEIGAAWERWTCQSAAAAGRLDILQYAHENGCDWSCKRGDSLENHMCCQAAKGGNLACLKYVHQNSACELIEYAAECAAKEGNLDCLKYLHQNGVELSSWMIARAAEEGGNPACIQYVQENNKPKRNLQRELRSAVLSKSVEAIRRLVREGANVDALVDGETSLIVASNKLASSEIVSLLVELGADVNVTTKYSRETVLHQASLHGRLDLARLLLDRGAEIEAKDYRGQTPLVMACITGKLELMNLLLDREANMEARDKAGFTAIFHACESGQVDAVQMLLERGANVNAVSGSAGWTPLSWAHFNGRGQKYAVIDLLLDRGALVQSGFLGMELMLKRGADINAQDNTGATPLFVASRAPPVHYTNNVGLLLKYGADPSIADHSGRKPIHIACENNVRVAYEQLIKHQGADRMVRDANGRTPMHIACEKGLIALHGYCRLKGLRMSKGTTKATLLFIVLALVVIGTLLSSWFVVVGAHPFL